MKLIYFLVLIILFIPLFYYWVSSKHIYLFSKFNTYYSERILTYVFFIRCAFDTLHLHLPPEIQVSCWVVKINLNFLSLRKSHCKRKGNFLVSGDLKCSNNLGIRLKPWNRVQTWLASLFHLEATPSGNGSPNPCPVNQSWRLTLLYRSWGWGGTLWSLKEVRYTEN